VFIIVILKLLIINLLKKHKKQRLKRHIVDK